MAFPDEPNGAQAPGGQPVSDVHAPGELGPIQHSVPEPALPESALPEPALPEPSSEAVEGVVLTDPYGGYQSGQQFDHHPDEPGNAISLTPPERPVSGTSGGGVPPKPPEPEPEEEDGMARMSFLEHLEELRARLLRMLAGLAVAFVVCLLFSDQLWNIVFEPAGAALTALGVDPPTLKLISPTDAFQIMWMKVPILFSLFLASPWVLYQVWAFISPGLYKNEKRYAVPFVVSSATLFILGGMFAYFIAFRYGLEFLLGMGIGKGIDPSVNVNEYYDLFVDVMLGVGIVFEIPVLLFLLTLVRVVSPAFLVRHSRYAILAIVILAAVITPTGDVFNLALFATPMILLFYVGIFAGYLLVLRREKRRFPWGIVLKWAGVVLICLAVVAMLVALYYGYHFSPQWPFFSR